jgi:hypothetical protein
VPLLEELELDEELLEELELLDDELLDEELLDEELLEELELDEELLDELELELDEEELEDPVSVGPLQAPRTHASAMDVLTRVSSVEVRVMVLPPVFIKIKRKYRGEYALSVKKIPCHTSYSLCML